MPVPFEVDQTVFEGNTRIPTEFLELIPTLSINTIHPSVLWWINKPQAYVGFLDVLLAVHGTYSIRITGVIALLVIQLNCLLGCAESSGFKIEGFVVDRISNPINSTKYPASIGSLGGVVARGGGGNKKP